MSDVVIMQAPPAYLRYGGSKEWADQMIYSYSVVGANGRVDVAKSVGFRPYNEAGAGFVERVAASPVARVTLADREGKEVGYVITYTGRGHRPIGEGWPTADPHTAVRLCGWHLSPEGIVGTGGIYNPGEVSMWLPLGNAEPTWTVSLEAPVGAVEIAERLGVARATVDQWRQRGLLPAPDWTVGGRPAWRWDVIATWAAATDRL